MQFQSSPLSVALTALAIFSLLLLTACGGGGGGGGGSGGSGGVVGVTGLSQTGSTNSHNDSRRGTDCLDCHTTGGSGTGVFVTAGTTSASNGFVEYYADPARTDLRARLEVDGYGNFYTVTAIDILTPNGSGFSQGAYVTIVTSGGSRRNMPGVISHLSAGCNECHSGPGTQSPL